MNSFHARRCRSRDSASLAACCCARARQVSDFARAARSSRFFKLETSISRDTGIGGQRACRRLKARHPENTTTYTHSGIGVGMIIKRTSRNSGQPTSPGGGPLIQLKGAPGHARCISPTDITRSQPDEICFSTSKALTADVLRPCPIHFRGGTTSGRRHGRCQ